MEQEQEGNPAHLQDDLTPNQEQDENNHTDEQDNVGPDPLQHLFSHKLPTLSNHELPNLPAALNNEPKSGEASQCAAVPRTKRKGQKARRHAKRLKAVPPPPESNPDSLASPISEAAQQPVPLDVHQCAEHVGVEPPVAEQPERASPIDESMCFNPQFCYAILLSLDYPVLDEYPKGFQPFNGAVFLFRTGTNRRWRGGLNHFEKGYKTADGGTIYRSSQPGGLFRLVYPVAKNIVLIRYSTQTPTAEAASASSRSIGTNEPSAIDGASSSKHQAGTGKSRTDQSVSKSKNRSAKSPIGQAASSSSSQLGMGIVESPAHVAAPSKPAASTSTKARRLQSTSRAFTKRPVTPETEPEDESDVEDFEDDAESTVRSYGYTGPSPASTVGSEVDAENQNDWAIGVAVSAVRCGLCPSQGYQPLPNDMLPSPAQNASTAQDWETAMAPLFDMIPSPAWNENVDVGQAGNEWTFDLLRLNEQDLENDPAIIYVAATVAWIASELRKK
ncbi:hypothetical protein CAOG_05223 [Capsaspora owczarzaki ATCC 30864]|uniref:Uncharacterized protein n=1 Tax=Capsaspora owczarzaki (strain ATCC 30864) TaxID=595528 RepID=A0A0D2UHQ0_CAPO3|nr:hypothetical protein CAOG_05223 [Capsaspora owczarzaki ATCC 30864]KJE94601.1 hypothetical protein CAOG_005223 [Capsaspora owczarzaki ATCC 30864]|eukprot:XP_004346908.1 hypothetical protein CAOG_05223 [Capsaspora owczarzaki ATCC 30864]